MASPGVTAVDTCPHRSWTWTREGTSGPRVACAEPWWTLPPGTFRRRGTRRLSLHGRSGGLSASPSGNGASRPLWRLCLQASLKAPFEGHCFCLHCSRFLLGPLRAPQGNPRWEEGNTVTTDVERTCRLGVASTGARAGRRDECGPRGGGTRAGRALRLWGTVRHHRSPVPGPQSSPTPQPSRAQTSARFSLKLWFPNTSGMVL